MVSIKEDSFVQFESLILNNHANDLFWYSIEIFLYKDKRIVRMVTLLQIALF